MKNRFGLSEWSGAMGDLGTTLPLAFALIYINGFPVERIFLLWGLAYVVSGWFYRVPVSIQPLKAMAVIAIAAGYSTEFLSSTALYYGILFILLSATGIIRWLAKWFSEALVRGIQLGIGLILAQKAFQLTYNNGLYLTREAAAPLINILLLIAVILLLWYAQYKKGKPLILLLLLGAGVLTFASGVSLKTAAYHGTPVAFTPPQLSLLLNSLIFLMIPQLPLTLGNAVFAASDACHLFWKKRSKRVNPTRLGFSIGAGNVIIGLLGGFPICHGAGGIAGHAQFGGKTGGTTIIIGSIFVAAAFIKPLSSFLLYIPIPILGGLLAFESWRLISLIKKVPGKIELFISVLVGLLSFATGNLTIAIIIGFLIERGYLLYLKKIVVTEGEKND